MIRAPSRNELPYNGTLKGNNILDRPGYCIEDGKGKMQKFLVLLGDSKVIIKISNFNRYIFDAVVLNIIFKLYRHGTVEQHSVC